MSGAGAADVSSVAAITPPTPGLQSMTTGWRNTDDQLQQLVRVGALRTGSVRRGEGAKSSGETDSAVHGGAPAVQRRPWALIRRGHHQERLQQHRRHWQRQLAGHLHRARQADERLDDAAEVHQEGRHHGAHPQRQRHKGGRSARCRCRAAARRHCAGATPRLPRCGCRWRAACCPRKGRG